MAGKPFVSLFVSAIILFILNGRPNHSVVSVVIICRNAVHTIAGALRSALRLTGDVVVIDTGSTDGTPERVAHYPVRLYREAWQGYGLTKNQGNALARHPWIVSMDADEELSPELIRSIRRLKLNDATAVYRTRRLSYFGNKAIHHGNWGRDYVTRLFHRSKARWDSSEVHEKLIFKTTPDEYWLAGVLHHYTAPCMEAYQQKQYHYACLMANKYLNAGKQNSPVKRFLSPIFCFLMQYIVRAGFLDGKEGWQIAKANAWYTFQKYHLLKQKQQQLSVSLPVKHSSNKLSSSQQIKMSTSVESLTGQVLEEKPVLTEAD